MPPLSGQSLKEKETADAAKRTSVWSRDVVFRLGRLRRRVGLNGIWRQQLSGAFEMGFRRRAEDAVVANLGGAAGQDVLKKPMDELDARKRDGANLLGAIVTITKTN